VPTVPPRRLTQREKRGGGGDKGRQFSINWSIEGGGDPRWKVPTSARTRSEGKRKGKREGAPARLLWRKGEKKEIWTDRGNRKTTEADLSINSFPGKEGGKDVLVTLT